MSTAADLSRACVLDMGHCVPASVQGIASLGSWGRHSQNQERDLHRWIHNVYHLQLEPFDIQIPLQAWFSLLFFKVLHVGKRTKMNSMIFSQLLSHPLALKADNESETSDMVIPFLLPHELFGAIADAGKKQVGLLFLTHDTALPPHPFSINSSAPHQICLSFTGGRSGPEIATFWEHCFKQEEWQDHPAKFLEYIQRDRILFALRFHYNYYTYVWKL